MTLENPDASQAASVILRYLPEGGGSPVSRVVVVAPHSRATVLANQDMPGQSFSLVVVASLPIVAERPMYFAYNGTQTGGSDVIGYQP
ncbi:MAG TPA: hypothetical protein VF807_13545 [Ktedonobacterales bacterium]